MFEIKRGKGEIGKKRKQKKYMTIKKPGPSSSEFPAFR
jgi:hypothetical protein